MMTDYQKFISRGAYFYMFHSIKKVADEIDKNSNERGIILDPILQPTMVPSAVIIKLFTFLYINCSFIN